MTRQAAERMLFKPETVVLCYTPKGVPVNPEIQASEIERTKKTIRALLYDRRVKRTLAIIRH